METSERIAVLVTGGAGYIGSHTCKALRRAGFNPITYDNLSLGNRWAVKWGPLVVGDLNDLQTLTETLRHHRVQAVVHFAASAYVGESTRNPSFYYRNNLITTLNLLDAMRLAGVPNLVFSSSCAVYGTPESSIVDEVAPVRPESPYGQTKLDCENAIRWFSASYGTRWIALRYFNAAGADPEKEIGECHEPETRLVPRAVLAALKRYPPLQVFGSDYPTRDGSAVRDYVHVADLATAHVKSIEALLNGRDQLTFNLGSGSGTSVRELLSVVSRIVGAEVPHTFEARRPGDPPAITADPSRAIRELGWSPALSQIDTIVRTAWEWHGSRTSS